MARLVQLQPIDPRATAGERATFGEAVSSGFTSAYTMGSVAENRRHAEIYGGWRQVFDRTIQGYMELPPDLGRAVARNDDSNGTLNSQIAARVAPGTYMLGVTQYHGENGVIRVAIERYVPAQ